jgi:hypothetical protein
VTEAEWLATQDPKLLLGFVRRNGSERKLRLFAVACCRSIWQEMPEECCRQAAEVGEQYADGLATVEKRHTAWEAIQLLKEKAVAEDDFEWAVHLRDAEGPVYDSMRRGWFYTPDMADQLKVAFVRDIFGNPFRPSPPLPPAVLAWNDRTVPRLAQAIYEERKMPEGTLDTARLAILADALLDAGCEDESLVQHCRSPGPHVRGCWAVDLLLGKS